MDEGRRPDAQHPEQADGAGVPDDPGDRLRMPLQVARSALDLLLTGEAGPLPAQTLPLLAEIGRALDEMERAADELIADVIARG